MPSPHIHSPQGALLCSWLTKGTLWANSRFWLVSFWCFWALCLVALPSFLPLSVIICGCLFSLFSVIKSVSPLSPFFTRCFSLLNLHPVQRRSSCNHSFCKHSLCRGLLCWRPSSQTNDSVALCAPRYILKRAQKQTLSRATIAF